MLTIRKAKLQEKVAYGKVRCLLCERRCTISEGEKGYCKTRVNIEGELYTIVYGDINALSENPIEKEA